MLIVAPAGTSDPSAMKMSIAQAQSTASIPGIQLPPPVPGLGSSPVNAGITSAAGGPVVPATPTALFLPCDALLFSILRTLAIR